MKQGRRVRGGDEGVKRVRNPADAGRFGEVSRAVAAAANFMRCRGKNLMAGFLAGRRWCLHRWKRVGVVGRKFSEGGVTLWKDDGWCILSLAVTEAGGRPQGRSRAGTDFGR
jgi:hypothetical protein